MNIDNTMELTGSHMEGKREGSQNYHDLLSASCQPGSDQILPHGPVAMTLYPNTGLNHLKL